MADGPCSSYLARDGSHIGHKLPVQPYYMTLLPHPDPFNYGWDTGTICLVRQLLFLGNGMISMWRTNPRHPAALTGCETNYASFASDWPHRRRRSLNGDTSVTGQLKQIIVYLPPESRHLQDMDALNVGN
jgi:hypothetical protein